MSEKSENAPLRYVGIGVAGAVFPSHRDAIQATGGELVAVCDVNAEAGQARADEYGCAFYTDHETMLRQENPDIAIIATPHPFHKKLAEDCLNFGCDVLVEKPLAVTMEEADAMVETARETGKTLAVNFQQRFRPEIRAAKKVLDEDRLGKILRVELVAVWNRTPAYYRSGGWRGTWRGEGGGILMNQAPHDLDLLCFLLGAPSRVLALTRTLLHDISVEDTAQAVVEWESGALGSLHFSTAEAGLPWKLDVLGTRGLLQIGSGSATLGTFEEDLRDAMQSTKASAIEPPMTAQALKLEDGAGDHRAVHRNFVAARRGDEPLSCDGDEARCSLQLANAMILSSYREKPVTLPIDRREYSQLLQELRESERDGEKEKSA